MTFVLNSLLNFYFKLHFTTNLHLFFNFGLLSSLFCMKPLKTTILIEV